MTINSLPAVEPRTTDAMPTTRSAALKVGATKYFTGVPCHKGHVTHRYTKSGTCAGCAHVRFAKVGNGTTDPEKRKAALKRWNSGEKARQAKQRWKEKDPKRAWAVYACGGAKERAARLGLPFELDKDYVSAIIPDRCPVFGTPFLFIGGKHLRPDSPTIDRLDPAKGYVRGNIAVISAKANAIKSNATAAEIQRVAEWLQETLGVCRGNQH